MWRALGYMFSIAIVVKAIAPEPSCDVCSKYDYEEKLLERVIRNELVLKDTLDKITYTHAKVELTLARIKDDQVKLYEIINVLEATKQNVSEAVQSIMSQTVQDVEVTKQNLRVDVDDFIDSRTRNITATVAEMTSSIQTLVVQTSKALHILRDQSAVPMVMFHACLQSFGDFTYAFNEDVVFKNVLVNEGDIYNPDTGHFTASVSGAYLFNVQYCPYPGREVHIDIVHDGKPLQRSRHGDKTYILCVTMQAFAKVALGDKVWVRSNGNIKVSHYDYFWYSFAGLLIHI